MIQPIWEKTKILDSLGKRSVSRYFVDTFLLPLCETAYANKKYDEKAIMNAIRNEMARLELLKVESKKGNPSRARMSSAPSVEAK